MCWPARLPNYMYDYNLHIIPNNQCPDPKTCLGTLEVFHIFWWQGDDFKSPLLGALEYSLSIVVIIFLIFRSSITRVYICIHMYMCTLRPIRANIRMLKARFRQIWRSEPQFLPEIGRIRIVPKIRAARVPQNPTEIGQILRFNDVFRQQNLSYFDSF